MFVLTDREAYAGLMAGAVLAEILVSWLGYSALETAYRVNVIVKGKVHSRSSTLMQAAGRIVIMLVVLFVTLIVETSIEKGDVPVRTETLLAREERGWQAINRGSDAPPREPHEGYEDDICLGEARVDERKITMAFKGMSGNNIECASDKDKLIWIARFMRTGGVNSAGKNGIRREAGNGLKRLARGLQFGAGTLNHVIRLPGNRDTATQGTRRGLIRWCDLKVGVRRNGTGSVADCMIAHKGRGEGWFWFLNARIEFEVVSSNPGFNIRITDVRLSDYAMRVEVDHANIREVNSDFETYMRAMSTRHKSANGGAWPQLWELDFSGSEVMRSSVIGGMRGAMAARRAVLKDFERSEQGTVRETVYSRTVSKNFISERSVITYVMAVVAIAAAMFIPLAAALLASKSARRLAGREFAMAIIPDARADFLTSQVCTQGNVNWTWGTGSVDGLDGVHHGCVDTPMRVEDFETWRTGQLAR